MSDVTADISPEFRARAAGERTAPPREGALEFLQRLIREQGDVARYETLSGTVFFFNHPDHVQTVAQSPNFERNKIARMLVGNGLLSSEGEYWRGQRRLMQPAFHERCIMGLAPMIRKTAVEMLHSWESKAAKGEALNLDMEMGNLTLRLILHFMFGDEEAEETQLLFAQLRILLDHVSDIADMMFQVPLELNPSRNARFRSALAAAHEIIHRKVNRRRAMANPPRDLLTLLLQAERLSEQQVMDEVVTMIVAGHESTAIPLTWVWRLFMRNPAAAERMNAELEQILQNRLPSAEDLPNLPYTKMVLEETLRLCPPISVTARQATVAETVGGVSIPAKGTVVVSAYTTHRHPDFWEDAEKFEPERFSTERSVNRHRYAYFPFYGGRHQCIGQPLAMLEGHLILATVASHCHLHPLPEHRYAPRPGIALRNPDGFPAHVEFRRPVLSD